VVVKRPAKKFKRRVLVKNTVDTRRVIITTPAVSKRMRAVRQRGTALETFVAKELKSRRVVFRRNAAHLPGRPDFYNSADRWALFVHGCFWHGHTGCKLSQLPKTNTTFWREKIEANCKRDLKKARSLRTRHWSVFTLWQCSLKNARQVESKIRLINHRAHRRHE
jgi:DNA mismatch endonuclease (patch repair protein)